MLAEFMTAMPKAELHVHLEGAIEVADMFRYAQRNEVNLTWGTENELCAAYTYKNLGDFLALFWQGCRVLTTREDSYDLTLAYLRRAHAQGVVCAEILYAPQNFLPRGITVDHRSVAI